MKRLLDRLIFFMVFSILVRRYLNIETSPWTMFVHWYFSFMEYFSFHNSDVIMSAMASQITDVPSVYLTVYLGADHRKHQSSASLRRSEKTSKLRVTGLFEGNSPMAGKYPTHKGPVTRKMLPFDDVIMSTPKWITFIHFTSMIY